MNKRSIKIALTVAAAVFLNACSPTQPALKSASTTQAVNTDITISDIQSLPPHEQISELKVLISANTNFTHQQLIELDTLVTSLWGNSSLRVNRVDLQYIAGSIKYLIDQNGDASELLTTFLDDASALALDTQAHTNLIEQIKVAQVALRQYGTATYAQLQLCQRNYSKDCFDTLIHYLSKSTLHSIESRESNDPQWISLQSLARIILVNNSDIIGQTQSLENWIAVNATTFAPYSIPEVLNDLNQALLQSPEKIAVVLPLSGDYATLGNAVKEGILISYFDNTRLNESNLDIQFIDSNRQNFAERIIEISQSSDLIIGPLLKENAAIVSELNLNQTPVLALNSDNEGAITESRYSFPLKSSDEGIEAAAQLWSHGYRNPLLLMNTSRQNQDIEETFVQTWEDLDDSQQKEVSKVEIKKLSAPSRYSIEVADALHITASNNRARSIRRALNEAIEFDPRRRQDIDSIFISAGPSNARQIKPLVAFHFGDDLPVYASSQAFNGSFDPTLDQDLNDVTIELQPWVIRRQTAESTAIYHYAVANPNIQSLVALGADSLLMGLRLQYFRLVPNAEVAGNTGYLSIDANNRITRRLIWAMYKDGQLVGLDNQ